ncbi:hypothetical protein HMPREF9080_00296 [Cardiobacterium valvarum F0432]|uniref:Protoporphyrinogen IX oxidase n=1 Tax=Cardiobacterium valvarum F0432 TaxID=797473 RepID=G9ZC19_9GAMM|nr:hypothetical protein HMPREF9080_00296 [Cardiobacterium valvarum F0432]
MAYLTWKALHIIGAVCWFAELFYLPRLYVYHAMAQSEGDAASPALLRDGAQALHHGAHRHGDDTGFRRPALVGGRLGLSERTGLAAREAAAGRRVGCLSNRLRADEPRVCRRTKPPQSCVLPLFQRGAEPGADWHRAACQFEAVLRVGCLLKNVPDFRHVFLCVDGRWREGSEDLQEFGIIGVLKQHGTHAPLPQFAEAGKFVRRCLPADGFRHQALHFRREGHDGGVEFEFDAGAVIKAAQGHQATDGRVVIQQVATGKAGGGADAAKAGFRRRAGEQGSDGGDDARCAAITAVSHLHGNAAAFGQGITIEGAQAAPGEQIGTGDGGAGMPGKTHYIGVVVFKDAVLGGAEEGG